MSTREIRVRLRAEVTDFKRQMAEAAKATDATASQFDKSGQKIQTVSGRMVRSAEVNREAWTTAGTALTAAGAAVTALGVAVARTGIEYNTLQQTSRAALTTMLGGATAANEQMDKLDDFARNSPFAKQVFISAQRQMIGFGIETQKVLPYLDSIQNAVAAMGGSNNDISELSRIISQISASSKITAVDLREFGNRGIDAATIIGSQMGMTGAEIRDSITAGTLDAGKALDALAAGMDERFGGAAENVKNTYEGALDRVRAAWRDLAADIASPLVDPDGGGMLVDLANDAADTMRAFQELPEPVKNSTIAIAGLAGAGTLAAGGFLLLLPRIIETRAAMKALSEISPRAAAGLGKFAKGGALVVGVTAGMLLVSQGANEMVDALTRGDDELGSNELERAIRGVVEAGGDLSALDGQFSNFGTFLGANRVEADGLVEVFDRLLNPSGLDQVRDAIGGSEGYMGQMRERAEGLDTALASMVSSGSTEYVEGFQQSLQDAGFTAAEINELLPETRDAFIGLEDAEKGAADSGDRLAEVQERAASAQDKLTDAREAYREEVDRWRGVMTDAFTSFIDDPGAYDAAIQKQMEWAQSQAATTESAEDSWEDFYDGVTVSAQAYIEELEKQVEAQQTWADNVTTVSDRLADSFSGTDLETARGQLEALASQGPASAGVISTLAGATDEELAEIVGLWTAGGDDAARGFVDEFQASADPFIEPKLDMTLAQITLDQWKRQEVELQVSMDTSNDSWIQSNIDAWTDALNGAGLGGGPATNNTPNRPYGYATGGAIAGPGTGTSDSIPIWASNGEFMQPADAHSFWGTRAMESLRNKDVSGLWRELGARGFASGGAVSAPPPQVVTVPVTQTYESRNPQTLNFYGGQSVDDGLAYAERRNASVLGGS